MTKVISTATPDQGNGAEDVEPSKPVSLADLDLGHWSAEEDRDFEVAEWVMGALIAWCSAQTARERAKAQPDAARLAELDAEDDLYSSVQRELSVRNPERVQEVLNEYGPIARARYQAMRPSAG